MRHSCFSSSSPCLSITHSSNIAKPILDVILYNFQLSRNVGAEGLIATSVLVQGSAALCTLTAVFVAWKACLYPHSTLHDARFRSLRSRGATTRGRVPLRALATHRERRRGRFLFWSRGREECALSLMRQPSSKASAQVIERSYFALIKHVNRIFGLRFWHGMLEDGIIKVRPKFCSALIQSMTRCTVGLGLHRCMLAALE